MAIEDLKLIKQDSQNDQTSALVPKQSVFQLTNIWFAGTIKLRSQLIEESMLLYGFIGKCFGMNIDHFKVKGMTIEFADEDGNFEGCKNKIYTKSVADFKMNYFYKLFPQLKTIEITSPEWVDRSYYYQLEKDTPFEKENYYFFESIQHPNPSAASSEIYLVCKYKKDDKTKYAIFAPHEVLLEQ